MKSRRLPAVAFIMLLISLSLVTSASYAWFALSDAVKATNLSLATTAPDNLLISKDKENWANSIVVDNVTGGHKIYPSSSANGMKFFTLTDDGNVIQGDIGGILHPEHIDLLRFKTADTPVSESADGYFTSYTLYIKTLGSSDVDIYVENLIPKAGSNIDDCIRIAIFNGSYSSDNLIGIYDAAAQDNVQPVKSVEGTLATLELADPKAAIGLPGPKITVPGGGSDYVTLVMNVWIEGQNSKCLNAIAGNTFNIDLKFDAVQPTP